MKSIVTSETYETVQVMSHYDEDNYEVDDETYAYFWNVVFLTEIEAYINSLHPGLLPEHSEVENIPFANFKYWETRAKYFDRFDRQRNRFFYYNDHIYSYDPTDFIDNCDKMDLIRYESIDLMPLLNRRKPPLIDRIRTALRL